MACCVIAAAIVGWLVRRVRRRAADEGAARRPVPAAELAAKPILTGASLESSARAASA